MTGLEQLEAARALPDWEVFEHHQGGALAGFGLGALGAVVIDASLLAYEEPQESPKKPRILPMGHATRHGGQIGIAGSF